MGTKNGIPAIPPLWKMNSGPATEGEGSRPSHMGSLLLRSPRERPSPGGMGYPEPPGIDTGRLYAGPLGAQFGRRRMKPHEYPSGSRTMPVKRTP
jgi:hypothetical protein